MQRHQVSDETKSSPPSFLIPSHLLPRTSIKRKKRASFTPRKNPSRHPRTWDPFPEPSPSAPQAYQEQDIPLSRRTKTDFLIDFILWDNQKKRFRRATQDEHEMIFDKIAEQFPNVLSIAVIFPWLIVDFEEDVPPTAERLFLIAGLVAIYLVEGEHYPLGISRIGTQGEGSAPTVPDSIASDLRPYHVPRNNLRSREVVFGPAGGQTFKIFDFIDRKRNWANALVISTNSLVWDSMSRIIRFGTNFKTNQHMP